MKRNVILACILVVGILALLLSKNDFHESPSISIGANFEVKSDNCNIIIQITNNSREDIHFKVKKLAKVSIDKLDEKDNILIIKEISYEKNTAVLKPKENYKKVVALTNLSKGTYNVRIVSECTGGTSASYRGTFKIGDTPEENWFTNDKGRLYVSL